MDTIENINNREWRPVEGYEGLYELRNDGLLYSYYSNTYSYGSNYGRNREYLKFSLYKNKKGTLKGAHQWVWITFVGPIPNGYDVHHKNGIKTDNRIENLELIEASLHRKKHFKERKEKMGKARVEKLSKSVLQYTLDDEFVGEYPSAREAERQTGIPNTNIISCCKRKYRHKTAGGYKWKYKEAS